MQINKIAAAVAVAFVGMSGLAQAAAPNSTQAAQIVAGASHTIYISGASAVKNSFSAILSELFTGTPLRIQDSKGDYIVAVGTLANTTSAATGSLNLGPWGGQTVAIVYRTKGGAIYGVQPVGHPLATGTAIESVTLASGGVSQVTDNSTSNADGTSAHPFIAPLTTAGNFQIPDAGISDVAPKFFIAPYNTDGEVPRAALTSAEIANLNPMPIYAISFATPVTNNVPLFTLTKSTVAAILAGNLATWDQVDFTAGTSSDGIVVCRRTPGSGSRSLTNLYFNGVASGLPLFNIPVDRNSNPAGVWSSAAQTYTVDAAHATGLVVVENDASGDVKSCLAAAAGANAVGTDKSYVTANRDGVGNPVTVTFKGKAGGYKAIGVLSTDSLNGGAAIATTTGWSFRSYNGAGQIYTSGGAVVTAGTGDFPIHDNLINASWDYLGWESLNVPGRTLGDTNKAPILAGLQAVAQEPSVLATLTNSDANAQIAIRNSVAGIVWDQFNAVLPDATTGYTNNVSRGVYLNNDQALPYTRNY